MVETMLLVAFLTATMWVGPFWMLMLLQPHAERTKKWMSGPWFVLGPLVAYLIVLAMNLTALSDMMGDGTLSGLVTGLADVLGTCLLYTSPSPRDSIASRLPSSA